jgi:hypothetical protein
VQHSKLCCIMLTLLVHAACSALLDQLPEDQRQQWLVLPPAVSDELAATSDLLDPPRASAGSKRTRTSTEGDDRLLMDAAIEQCVGGQVRSQSCCGPTPWTHSCQLLIVVSLALFVEVANASNPCRLTLLKGCV